MDVVVAAAFPAGSLKAHAINTIKMALGFARLGHRVTMILFEGDEKLNDAKLAERYALKNPPSWICLKRRSWFGWGRKADMHMDFARAAGKVIRRIEPDFVFTRNFALPLVTSQMGIPTVMESHAHVGDDSPGFQLGLEAAKQNDMKSWVTISPVLAEYYEARGVKTDKLLILPDAVDLIQFAAGQTQQSANPYKTGHAISQDDDYRYYRRGRVVYTGHLYDYKGIATVLEAAKLLPDVAFDFVGGLPEDLSRQQARAEAMQLENVTFHGMKNQSDLPPYLWHADAALLPPSLNHPSAHWTSPVKLGEYLAAGLPVIASDIPALKYWLNENTAEFFKADNPASLAVAIEAVLSQPDRHEQLVKQGLKLAKTLSYQERAKAILHKAFCTETNPLQSKLAA